MSLSKYRVGATVAVSDMTRAKEFYEGRLGLSAGTDDPDGGRTYECAGGTTIHVYPSPAGPGKSAATLAGWEVDDLERVVGDLTSRGVTFEKYTTPPFATDEKGIAVIGGSKSAWFKDPDGNTLGLIQR